jgi:hypothetical protein
VSPADWIATIARAYLAAPEGSTEENLLIEALYHACERVGVDRDALIDRMVKVAPVPEVVFDEADPYGNAEHDKECCDCLACENWRAAEESHGAG